MTLKEDFENLKNKTRSIESSIALEILKDYKKTSKRDFIEKVLLILCLVGSFAYIVYLLNDIQVVTTTDTIDVRNVDTIEHTNFGIGK